MISTSVAVADWIKRIADEERRLDGERLKQSEVAARKIDLVRRHGRRILDDLRAVVVRDVNAFRDEFQGDAARNVTVDTGAADGGFTVAKPAPAAVLLTVAPNVEDGALICCYRFTPTGGMPPREDRLTVTFIDDGSETPRMKHHGTAQSFVTADALSEFLLVPVLTGRPR